MTEKELRLNRYRFGCGDVAWSQEKTRTFNCPQCGTFVVPEHWISVSGKSDYGYDLIRSKDALENGSRCPKCKAENYEFASFLYRYGLITRPHAKRAKPDKEPLFSFHGGIDCTGRNKDGHKNG
jgi:predicted nucleic-acid-binding Zn-ribbon protein